MMLLVTGGSASGKSAYAGKLAESLMVNKESCHREILYVATLADRSPESKRRIERHKSLRDGGCYKVAECLSMEDLRNLSVSLSEAGRKDFSEYAEGYETAAGSGRESCGGEGEKRRPGNTFLVLPGPFSLFGDGCGGGYSISCG